MTFLEPHQRGLQGREQRFALQRLVIRLDALAETLFGNDDAARIRTRAGHLVELPQALGAETARQSRARQAQQLAQCVHAHAAQPGLFLFGPVQVTQ